ncbi:hypothetical protein Pfo_018828, partial [Paulownia fortunei]
KGKPNSHSGWWMPVRSHNLFGSSLPYASYTLCIHTFGFQLEQVRKLFCFLRAEFTSLKSNIHSGCLSQLKAAKNGYGSHSQPAEDCHDSVRGTMKEGECTLCDVELIVAL